MKNVNMKSDKGRKRVLIIGPLPPPVHGVTVAVSRLLRLKELAPFDMIHLDTSDHRPISTIGKNDMVNYILSIKSYIEMLKILLKNRPSSVYVIISQSFLGFARDSIYIILGKIICRSRIIIHLHGGYFNNFYHSSNILTKKYVDLIMRHVNKAIVLSQCFKNIFSKWLKEDQIEIVHNCCEPIIERVGQRVYGENSAKRQIQNITFLSNLIPEKGVFEFVKAGVECLKSYPHLVFWIGGAWLDEQSDLRNEIKKMINSSEETRNNIREIGYVFGKEKNDLLFKTDILVLPTYYIYEGSPTVIIEAMAGGIPVIATDHAGIPDLVVDKETGFLVPKKDFNSIVDRVKWLIQNQDAYKEMSIKSFKKYCCEYTLEKCNSKLISSLS
jgi:glycosyltransferase involved in cell wall biosynthesis